MDQTDIRLTVSEAGRVFGVSQQTIRRAIKAQLVKYIVVRGRYRLSFASLLSWSQHATSTRNKLAKQGIGQYVAQWKIQNRLYSPHPDNVKRQINQKSSA
jgi:excisionase family DNA binding protein